MSNGADQESPGGDLRCPTCGASQSWSDACRRCRCDLTLLRRVAEVMKFSRRRSLCALRTGNVCEAVRHASYLHALCPDQSSTRLLAVCHLLQGNWSSAINAARMAERDR